MWLAGDGRAAAMDEDDDVPSPRTLRAAAERLAQYTSEEIAAGPEAMSGARFADLYSEVQNTTGLPGTPVTNILGSASAVQSADTFLTAEVLGWCYPCPALHHGRAINWVLRLTSMAAGGTQR